MTNILHINSSLFGNDGKSSQMANEFVQALRNKLEESALISRDLNAKPLPHLDGERFTAFTTPAEQRSDEQKHIVAESDQLIKELRDADILVLGIPLYNLGVPSTFKAYIDHIARAGETFRYTANGPEGLLNNKKVYVFAARGGQYQDTPLDTQTPYLRHIFGLMGLQDIEFIYAEGLNMGPDIADASLANARKQLASKAA
ncbi:FMN-dependent NADH-azoreductase [Zhongshania aliphaticivorans]|uniref:FMN dependent NADH:quinone oxidoreductase n=1 Tax=Zhongshania aliphaticivorans TaxID=1470434 RepID=A0A5S9PKD9_9GAMM|nr:NAD(P)H-dependent oxidoreductase [Zhongshania aliphaticivorans]CAA0104717.1 FMN-dependent NADH-azoreductase [Zhongshania aliphaticivorans]CAA0104977.1 FMN-dependent NADH-azoreductase [Zhongshania aliphaticivorans]